MSVSESLKKVYLIGAGPGNTYLITVRAQSLIKQAEVIIYDYLANDILLDMTSPESEKIYVGKHAGSHTFEQEQINEVLLKKAQEGKRVVRLKGGDPFIFGRGGEEAEYLKENGIDYEVVPGITAATGALSYAGIPLTHRGLASMATIITGHEDPTKENSHINWEALGKMTGTLVFYMGVKRLPKIVDMLISNGKPKITPAALIRMGTTPQQETVTGTLETIVDNVKEAGLRPPALIVVGEVVKMREKINWYEELPLFGKSIMVTRSAHQTEEFSEQISILGAEIIHKPTIEVVPPDSYDELDQSLLKGDIYDWVIFTSVNGVRHFEKRLKELDIDIRIFHKAKFAGIGSASRKAIRDLGIKVEFVPKKFSAEGFVKEFKEVYPDISGQKILFPAANIARDLLPQNLTELGGEVHKVTAYQTASIEHDPDELLSLFLKHKVSLVTFTSSSTVDNFFDQFREKDLGIIKQNLNAASIGKMTTKSLQEHGIEPMIEATVSTIPGLLEEIVAYYKKKNGK